VAGAALPLEEVQRLLSRDPRELTKDELEAVFAAEADGGVFPGELPFEVAADRERCLESPSYMMTKILDPWYEDHFEPIHYKLVDDVLGPWLIGETARIDGINYDPKEYTGLLVTQSRSTLKSTILRMMVQWISVYRKLRMNEDARVMFVHQVKDKAIKHSESIRQTSKRHSRWRCTFPEFAAPEGEWDTREMWRWACYTNYLATEWSFTAYGETSSKEGGHYTDQFVDDWVTQDSVTTPVQQDQSFENFRAMDNLRDRARPYVPWMAMGTYYHHQDTYKRLEAQGGWLVWRLPAHTGSAKRIFDICAIDERTEDGRQEIREKLDGLESDPPGKLHFPKMLPWRECYRTARATGSRIYNCQILLNPVPETEARFDLEALADAWVDDLPGSDVAWVYIRCDPAISEKRTADETAYVVGAVHWDATRTIIDGWVGRESRATEIVRKGYDFARKWQSRGYTVKSIGYEAVAYQEALASIAREGIPERSPAYHGESVPMLTKPCQILSIKRPPDKSKPERILSMDGPVTRRELKVWRKCPIGQRVISQLSNFPYDRFDILDAMHDLWIRVLTPPPPLNVSDDPLHPELMKLIRKHTEAPTLVGTNSTVKLLNWGQA
jgi:hypothetical protein